jgi:hypothetical protein
MIRLQNFGGKKTIVRPFGYQRLPDTKTQGFAAAPGPAPVLTLGETDKPLVGERYNIFECAFYALERKEEAGAYEYDGECSVLLSLVEPSDGTIIGSIYSENGDLLHELAAQGFKDQTVFRMQQTFSADDGIDQDTLRLTVEAEFFVGGQPQRVCQTVPLVRSKPDDFFTYTKHVHPSKRAVYDSPVPEDRKYGKTVTNPIFDTFGPDDNYVQIAMFRKPDNTNDVDYICAYGESDKKPIVGLPGEGTLACKGGSFKFYEATCLLRRKSGGAHVLGVAYETDQSHNDQSNVVTVISVTQMGSQFVYKMPPDRTAANEYWAKKQEPQSYTDFSNLWTETPFDYEMTLVFRFEGMPSKTVIITSDETLRASDLNTYIFTVDDQGGRVLPLKIGGGCLAPGTMVITRNGNVPIESVRIGDSVKSTTSPGGWAKVRNVWNGVERGEMVEVDADGQTLLMTKNHPVYTRSSCKKACELNESDELSFDGGQFKKVGVKIVPYDGKVYNLDTEGDYGFIANGIMVGTNRTQNTAYQPNPSIMAVAL